MEQLINFIIRPPRAEYNPDSDLLDQEFLLKGKWYQRKDVEVKNSRRDILKCSHYVPIGTPDEKQLPCVIYCHGNSGCRADASEAAIILLPSNITVFTLDFSGSGLSGGEHVTLGWNEKDDLKAVVEYLRQDGNVSLIGLWGRSMGAVTSLMYGAEDPSIAGMVLDSPFSDLVDLMMELVDTYKIRLPKFTVKFAIQYMKKAIQKKAKFDITELNTIKVAKCCFVPALFGHAIDDDFIQPHHSDRIYEAYMGDKNIIKFEGDHNSPRPQFYFDSINIFFHNILQPPEDEVKGTYFDTMHGYFDKDGWTHLHDGVYTFESSATSKGISLATSKESSTSQTDPTRVRPKLPMSRMEVPSDVSRENKETDAEGKENDHDQLSSSSSNMINFELSDGHPYGPHVPTTMDDDQYVEYQLDDLTGFPGSAEEEERMLMEAVIASLKDLEMRQPPTEEQGTSDGTTGAESMEPSSNTQHSDSPEQVSNPTSKLQSDSSKAECTLPVMNSQTSVSVHPLSTPAPAPPPTQTPTPPALSTASASDHYSSAGESARSTITSTGSESSRSVRSSTDTDVSGNTKATVTVERNPASHIMDGLIRRWDFNLFRSNR